MIKTVSFGEFCDTFSDTYKNNFSYQGKRALYDYLNEYEEETETPYELDTVSLCCDYTEYANLKEMTQDYSNIKTMEELRDNTQVIEIPDTEGFIIQQF
jgi:hypothetical protein